MKKRVSLVLAAILAVSALLGVSQASAATEFGSGCAAEAEVPYTLVSLTHGAGSPLPVAAPTSGVITQWSVKSNIEGISATESILFSHLFRQTLGVFRPAGANAYTLVAESEGGPLSPEGTNVYPARIPVQAGDHLGLVNGYAVYCPTGDPADTVGFKQASTSLGSTIAFTEETMESETQVPVVAKIEPDVDGDGYGDETQDLCPQSAAYQTACPVVTLSSKSFVAGKKAVTVYVASSLSAPVGVTASVNLGKAKKATLTAAAQTVAPGSLAPFKLTLTSTVTKALKELSTKKSLTLSVTASATNVAGAPSTSTSTVKLKGQAKPAPKKHKQSKK